MQAGHCLLFGGEDNEIQRQRFLETIAVLCWFAPLHLSIRLLGFLPSQPLLPKGRTASDKLHEHCLTRGELCLGQQPAPLPKGKARSCLPAAAVGKGLKCKWSPPLGLC